MILSPDQLHMQQSEVWKGYRRITRTIADRPLSGNPQGAVHDQHEVDYSLPALVSAEPTGCLGEGERNVCFWNANI
ncbi:hypothetical protein [Acetobacter ascendens]|uniref:hypothetical protein n=1 Tax=Acetobacter ascendens TaxID=481146 RepID=UPI00138FFDA2|nr:hypothetical protein [Acetobacter ascendens]